MKKFRKIMAVLVAAIMIVAMTVPAFSTKVLAGTSGRISDTTQGAIYIHNPHEGTVYDIYRLFELASFTDDNVNSGQHSTDKERYSYVINEKNEDGTAANPWYTFLTDYGPEGAGATQNPATGSLNYPYALEDDGNLNTASEAYNHAYFIIQDAAISLTPHYKNSAVDTYHVIKAGPMFDQYKVDDLDDTGSTTVRAEDPGKGIDYVTNANNARVQAFAQEALKYAVATNTITAFRSVTAGTDPAPTIAVGQSSIVDENNLYSDSANVIEVEVPLGYYLIGSTMGSLASLDTTNNTTTIYEKNDEPTITKTVHKKGADALKTVTNKTTVTSEYGTDDKYRKAYFGTEDWVKNTDANIGDYVQFRIRIRAQQGIYDYRIHDVMEKGLDFVQDASHPVIVKLVRYNPTGQALTDQADANITYTYDVQPSASISSVSKTNYTVFKATSGAEGLAGTAYTENSDFIIQFADASLNAYGNDRQDFAATDEVTTSATAAFVDIKDDDCIFVYYWAQLNEYAAIWQKETVEAGNTAIARNNGNALSGATEKQYIHNSDGRNNNYAILTYGKNNTEASTWTDASVTTYAFDIVKTEGSTNATYNLLAGAKFNLYKATSKTGTLTPEDGTPAYTHNVSGGTTTYFFKGDAVKFNQSDKYYHDKNGATDIDTVAGAETYVRGLEAGTYLLYETLEPAGYDKLAYPIALVINPDTLNDGVDDTNDDPREGTITTYFKNNQNVAVAASTIKWDAETVLAAQATIATYTTGSTQGGLHVINTTGTELPSTGGMGTTVLYIVGGMLVILAGAYLFFSRKRTA